MTDATETLAAEAASDVKTEAVEAAPVTPDAVDTTAAVDPTAEALAAHGNTVIRHNVYLAAAAGIIPFTFVDTAALIAIQLKLIRDLSKVYGKDFRADLGKSAVSSLLASVTPTVLTGGVLGSSAFSMLAGNLPVVGTALRLATQPVFGGAFTYAVGKVFQHHFANGGDLLSFEAGKVKEFFTATYNDARTKVGSLGKGVKDAVVPAPDAPVAA